MKKILLTILPLLMCSITLLAQDVEVKTPPNFYYPEKEITYTDVKKILTKVGDAVSYYQIYMTLLGDDGKVDKESVKNYNSLFDSNAKMLDDLATYPTMISYQDYSATVFNYLENEGVYFKIKDNEASALKINIDPSKEFYYIDVQFTKIVYTLLDNSFKASTCKSGREVRTVIKYILAIDDVDSDVKPKISEARGEVIKDCSDASLSITPYVRYGLGFVGNGGDPVGLDNNLLLEGHDALTGGIDGASLISIGAKINYAPFKEQKNLSLTGGFAIGLYTIKHSLGGDYTNSSQTDKDANPMQSNYDRIIRLRGAGNSGKAEEKISVTALEIPLGISYKIAKNGNKTLSLIGDFHVVPIMAFGGNAKTTGMVSYEGWYDNYQLLLKDLPSWGFATDENVDMEHKINSKFSLAVEISPSVQYLLNKESGLGIEFGLDYRLGLTNLLNNDTSHGDVLLNDNAEDMRGSILENYYDGSKLHSLGVHLGLILEL